MERTTKVVNALALTKELADAKNTEDVWEIVQKACQNGIPVHIQCDTETECTALKVLVGQKIDAESLRQIHPWTGKKEAHRSQMVIEASRLL